MIIPFIPTNLIFDFMVNHISASSEYYQDFLKNKENSPYYDYFIKYSEFSII